MPVLCPAAPTMITTTTALLRSREITWAEPRQWLAAWRLVAPLGNGGSFSASGGLARFTSPAAAAATAARSPAVLRWFIEQVACTIAVATGRVTVRLVAWPSRRFAPPQPRITNGREPVIHPMTSHLDPSEQECAAFGRARAVGGL